MEYEDFWNQGNRMALSYFIERVKQYEEENLGFGYDLDSVLFGVNGERSDMAKMRIGQVNMLSSVARHEPFKTIDNLFEGNPHPDEILLRLKRSDLVYMEMAGNPEAFNLNDSTRKNVFSFCKKAFERKMLEAQI